MKLEKLKNRAQLLSFLSVLVITGSVGYQVFVLLSNITLNTQFSAAQLLSIPYYVILILTVVNAILMLRSIASNNSPFTPQNASRLNTIGWLLIAFEPMEYVIQTISNRYFPLRIGDGMYMTTQHSYGGIFMISGFAVLAVSVIFHYGIELQTLSDETL